MQDPASGVQQPLLQHVHLQSSFSFPYSPQPLTLEHALEHLLRAPQIIREVQPVAWTYLNQPSDGALLLTWQPLNLLGNNFATDGYLWASQENAFQREINGYTVEVLVNESGFGSGHEQVATHRRMRYHLLSHVNNAPVDPALQLVHYLPASPEHRLPIRMFRPQPQQQHQLTQRRVLESQGPLMRKEFMLNDRNNWPTITMPGGQIPPIPMAGGQIPANPYQQNAMYNRPGAPPFARTPSASQPFPGQPQGVRHGSIGASPAKRGASAMAQGGVVGHSPMAVAITHQLAEEMLENERNLEYGDALDFLTPREISAARYKQHHEWMEEVLSSPYSTSQIIPVDLGLRLSGSLSELTEALWENGAAVKMEKANGAKIPNPSKIDPEKMAEFERRVAQFMKKGEDDMASMKESHAQTINQHCQLKIFSKLERQLAEIPADAGSESLEQLCRDVEKLSGSVVVPRQQVTRVQDGGILKVGEENVALANQTTDEFADFTNLDTAGEALDFYTENMEYPG